MNEFWWVAIWIQLLAITFVLASISKTLGIIAEELVRKGTKEWMR